MKIKGTVIKGIGQAGAEFGVETANLAIKQLEAHDGVYAATAFIEGESYNAIAFLGQAHLVEGKPWRCEIHVLEGEYDLYGKELEVELLHKIRDTMVFTEEALAAKRITKDLELVNEYFR